LLTAGNTTGLAMGGRNDEWGGEAPMAEGPTLGSRQLRPRTWSWNSC